MAQTDKQTDKQTNGHGDSMTESAQWAGSVKMRGRDRHGLKPFFKAQWGLAAK